MIAIVMGIAFAVQALPKQQLMELRCAAAGSWYHRRLVQQGSRDLPLLLQSYGMAHFFAGRLSAVRPGTDWLSEAGRLSSSYGENEASLRMLDLCRNLQRDMLR